MSKWGGGPLPFKADAIASLWDERNCIYWAYRVDDKLYLRIRGSRPPYPISDAELIGDGYYGTGSLMIWKDGYLNIFWPNKSPDKVMQKYTKASDIPDPSIGSVEKVAGTSHYQLLTEPKENATWFLEQSAANGGNATEITPLISWSGGWKHSFYKQVGTWTEAGKDWDPNYEFPMFDLDQWNEETWSKFRHLCDECERLDMTLFTRIHDYCSVKTGFEKRHYPFSSNIQRMHKPKRLHGGIWGTDARKWYSPLNTRIMDIIHASRVKYKLQPMNEADVVLGEDDTEEWADEVCIRFHQFMIDGLIKYGASRDDIILSIDRPNVFNHFKDLGFTMEIHKIASPEALTEAVNRYGTNIFPNGDGPDLLAAGDCNFKNYCGPSYAQNIKIGKLVIELNLIGYCFLQRSTEPAPGEESVLLAKFESLKGLVLGLQ